MIAVDYRDEKGSGTFSTFYVGQKGEATWDQAIIQGTTGHRLIRTFAHIKAPGASVEYCEMRRSWTIPGQEKLDSKRCFNLSRE
ncbi:unnamed protein product [Sphagnum balticum]